MKKSFVLPSIILVLLLSMASCKKEDITPPKTTPPVTTPKTNIDLVDAEPGYYFIADKENSATKMNCQKSKGFTASRSGGVCMGPAGKYYHTTYSINSSDNSLSIAIQLYRTTSAFTPFSLGDQPFRGTAGHLYDGIDILYEIPGTFYDSYGSVNSQTTMNIYNIVSNSNGTKTYYAKVSNLVLSQNSGGGIIKLGDVVLSFTI